MMTRYSGQGNKAIKRIRDYKVREQDNKCYWCKRPFGEKLLPTADHIIRHRDGGKISDQNIVAACLPCNQAREL